MNEKVSINETAKILGMSPSCVRIRMERNLFNPPIGRVIPSLSGKGTRYFVYREMLDRYIKGE